MVISAQLYRAMAATSASGTNFRSRPFGRFPASPSEAAGAPRAIRGASAMTRFRILRGGRAPSFLPSDGLLQWQKKYLFSLTGLFDCGARWSIFDRLIGNNQCALLHELPASTTWPSKLISPHLGRQKEQHRENRNSHNAAVNSPGVR